MNRFHIALTSGLTQLRRLVVPARCVLCAADGLVDRDLCGDCSAALPRVDHCCARCAIELVADQALCGRCLRRPPFFDRALTALHYRYPAAELIQRFKFQQGLSAGRLLAQLLSDRLRSRDLPQPDWVMPVPLSRQRLRQRGFNQALEIARVIAADQNWPLATHALQRVRDTPAQSGLTAVARRRNVRGAFALRAGFSVENARLLLVDDVLTTGATLSEIAKLLKRAGAAEVMVAALARA